MNVHQMGKKHSKQQKNTNKRQRITAMNGPRYGNSINKSASMLAAAVFFCFVFRIVDLVAGAALLAFISLTY